MLIPRVIPCLLLRGSGLVKTERFADPKYVGDIINAVKIFNDKEVDEIIILDIEAHKGRGRINWELVTKTATEAFMPMCYGGGVTSLDEIKRLFKAGIEKVSINTASHSDPRLIESAAKTFGSQSIVAGIDVKKGFLGRYAVVSHGGDKKQSTDVVHWAKTVERAGAGEILLNSVDRDGTRSGYDLELVRLVTSAVRIPVIACGGAGKVEHFAQAIASGASAVAAGSLFVFHGPHRAVLITYPERTELTKWLAR
ncbi:MAG: imidazole glycerol phosphate synthase subunit HisF [Kofleriaceae bacterium]|nr:imidazole glycerol phosphate synthase subunit HisF [Kofleriaceae bacterium]